MAAGGKLTLHPCPKERNHPNCQLFMGPVDSSEGSIWYFRSHGADLRMHANGGAKAGAELTLHPCLRQNRHANCQ